MRTLIFVSSVLWISEVAATRRASSSVAANSRRHARRSQANGNAIQQATKTKFHLDVLGTLRGGSTSKVPPDDVNKPATATTKSTKKKGEKKQTSSPSKKPAATSMVSKLFELNPMPADAVISSTAPSLQLEGLLINRYVSLKWLARFILAAMTLWQLQACRNSAGIPRRQAIWSILHDAKLVREGTSPTSFQPTPLESFLATTLARVSRDMIPPSSMPSGGPLLGAMIGGLAFVFITVLLPHWFYKIRVWYDYQQISPNDALTPTAVLIARSQSTKSSFQGRANRIVCQLHGTSLRARLEHNLPPYYFECLHRRYYCDPACNNQCWEGGPNWNQLSVGELMTQAKKKKKKKKNTTNSQSNNEYVGLLQAPSQLVHAQERWYPYNHQTSVPIPSLTQALWARLQSPLVVAQLIGKAVAVLEEGKAAVWSFAMTLFQHYNNARANIQSSKRLQQDVAGLAQEFSKRPVWIYRGATWKLMESSDLLPGDLFWMSAQMTSLETDTLRKSSGNQAEASSLKQSNKVMVPVDALLLEGVCVTMEAVLTGESVPQTKMPLDSTTSQWNQTLDMAGVHRQAVLFAGTTLIHSTSSASTYSSMLSPTAKGHQNPPGPGGALCLALRTGSYSSKGEIISALTSSRAKSSVAAISNPQFDMDALKLISTMSVVTVIACASLFWGSKTTKVNVSGFRRIIQCTRIATACIPSDLPMYLSYVVQSCAHALRQEADVVCSQPGALLTASQIDTVVFDKTGTLTADTQSLSRVITRPEKKERKKAAQSSAKRPSEVLKEAKDMEVQTAPRKPLRGRVNLVLAGCHSLVHVAGGNAAANCPIDSASLVGDPLELAALRFSGWLYDTDGDYYYPTKTDAANPEDVEKLWQLRVFPFNPSARLSSALCLARHSNGKYKLWVVIKGAPEAVLALLDLESNGGQSFSAWYVRRVKQLEERGYRALAMAAKELSFSSDTPSTSPESDILREARQFSETIHRRDVEACDGSSTFCGLACFHAEIRPSSKRIVEELELGNIRTSMLTGDSLSAALAVARKVGILRKHAEVAVLELDLSSEGGSGDSDLQWRTILARTLKDEEEVTKVTRKNVDEILQRMRRGELQMAASGNALTTLLSNQGKNGSYDSLIENLHCFSVVARASPECKERFVASLKGRRVLMSGDGVNDVSAMKEAEVSVALLNGFGRESESSNQKGRDTEDDRRKQRLKDKSKRESRRNAVALDAEGIGSSTAAANARIKARIEKAQLEITMRALKRQSVDGVVSSEPQYTLADIKDMLLSVWSAGMEERRRSVKLRQGGSEAASILAGEDELLRKGSGNDGSSTQPSVEIRPGEACIASPFSCLRSSIDGVEAVIRAGIATAACALSVQQKITLHSLITCFNLSALFRDGFRYGNNMSLVDMMLYSFIDSLSFRESCKMRPRLPRSKLPSMQSLFAPANFFSVTGQVLIHLLSTEVGILFARQLEKQITAVETAAPTLVRAAKAQTPRMTALTNALIKSISGDSDEGQMPRFLRRPKFVPNYETNVVFILSLLQSIVTTLLLHKGAPFYPSLLESGPLSYLSGFSVIFVVACILETFPPLNHVLELRPWISNQAKFLVLALALVDALSCIAVEYLCRRQFRPSPLLVPHQSTSPKKGKVQVTKTTAADLEEKILSEETTKNLNVVLVCCAAVVMMTCGALFG